MGPGEAAVEGESSWAWTRVLYAILVLAAVSLLTLVVGDAVSALEGEEGDLHHLFVFDLAWPVFLISGVLALFTGLAALALGALRHDSATARYGLLALGFCALAVVVVLISETLAS